MSDYQSMKRQAESLDRIADGLNKIAKALDALAFVAVGALIVWMFGLW